MKFKSQKRLAAAVVAVCSLGSAALSQAAIVTQFTFESYTVPTTPTGANSAAGAYTGPVADTGTGQFSAFHNLKSTYSTPAGNGTNNAFGSNNWSSGDYYQFTSTQAATPGLQLEFSEVSSSTGPTSFTLEYSVDGVNFLTPTGGVYGVSNTVSFSATAVKQTSPPTYLFDFTGMSDIESATSLTFRLVDNVAPASAGGTDRVDTVTLGTSLTPIAPTPEPASLGLIGVAGMALVRRRK